MNPALLRPRAGLLACATLILLAAAGSTPAQDHDLVLAPAADLGSTNPADRLSPDMQIGADFGAAGAVATVRRGIPNRIYPRLYINGIADHLVGSGGIGLNLYARPAALGDAVPPLTDPTWVAIDSLPVTHTVGDGPFALTRVWPTDFPSVMGSVAARSVLWTPPAVGDLFQVALEAAYLPVAGVTDDHPADNLAVSLYESASGLIDVVLVHDTSGSMGFYTHGGYPYIDLAKASASAFIAALGDDDRFGVVEFSSDTASGYRDVYAPGGALAPAGFEPTLPGSTDHKAAAAAAIAGLNADGMTPLGAGLKRGIDLLTAPPPDGIPRKRIVLLLSDGYENDGTPLACDGADATAPCAGSGLAMQLQANEIRAYTLALGPAAWTACLDCIATASNARFYATPPGMAMTEVYLHMQQDFTGDDLYAVDYGSTGGGDDAYALAFEGAGDVLYFILSWNELDAPLGLALKAPGGDWSDAGNARDVRVLGGRGWLVARVGNAAAGDWGYRVTGRNGIGYLAAVRSDRVGLRLGLDARAGGSANGQAGDPIAITARLTRAGQPIDDAVLTATLVAPAQASFDTALRGLWRQHIAKHQALPVDAALLTANPDLDPRVASVQTLTGGDGSGLVQEQTFAVPLTPVGDGLYRAEVPGDQTRLAGTYRVTVDYADGGDRRTQQRQVRLQPGPVSAAQSFAEIVPMTAAEAKTWRLRTYPADRFGNAVTDPALRNAVTARVEAGYVGPLGAIAADGAIEQVVVPWPNRVPRLTAAGLAGKGIHVGPIPRPDDGGPGQPEGADRRPPILWLALVLALLWLWWRRAPSS